MQEILHNQAKLIRILTKSIKHRWHTGEFKSPRCFMKLLKHQQIYLSERNLDKDLLAHEGGTGKTIIGVEWIKQRNYKRGLVLCPKRVVKKWRDVLPEEVTILSREDFKKNGFEKPSAIIVDEADEWASPLFIPKLRSQRSEKLYQLIKENDVPVLLLTATPIRSTPWNLHTLLCFMGVYIDHKKWQNRFFNLERRPYLPRPAWFPKEDWRTLIRPTLEKYAHIVLMRDCVDELPAVSEITKFSETKGFVKHEEWEPMKAFVEEHRFEQTGKLKEIKEIASEYRKVIVVVHYREQIETLQNELSKERETFVLYGGVKDQEDIIKKAQESDECYFIIQASLAAGYDLDSFSCLVFASMSFKYVDFVQMKFRVRRIHNLHPVVYYYLIGGRCDNAVYERVMLGKEFDPHSYMQYAT